MRQLGYTRVSTASQDAQLQLDALVAAGVQKRDVFADVTSGSRSAAERPGMQKLLGYAEPGDTVVVWRVDRLGRSLIDVLNTVSLLRERGIQVRSVSDGIDPATSTGRLMLNMLATLAEQNWEPVLKPWPLRPPVEGGFTLDDFTHDPAAATLTCPAGITRPVSSKGTVTYGVACRGCPLRQRCTTAATGRKVKLGEHHQLQREHRVRATAPTFQSVYRQHRPMVERSIAWLTRGNRRVPYRGVDKNNAWLHHRAAGLNLRRLLALGLTTHDGAWALA